MPYPQAQARAIFLRIKREKGEGAAKAFGRKHRDDLAGAHGKGRRRYKPRSR